jgi:hypothetical protein
MMVDLTASIFEGEENNEVSSLRRNLQVSYVRRLIDVMSQDYYDELSTAAVYSSLRTIQKLSKQSSSPLTTRSHRKYISWIIQSALDTAN